MRELAQQFMEIFDGLDRAYGTYIVKESRADGKRIGEAKTLKKPVTIELWEDHLLGKQAIGIIPIKDNSKCKFGAIDIDVYIGLDLPNIVKQINKLGYPLIPCRSKSGGCHLYLFMKEEISADILQNKLKEMAGVLGYGNCEIYPRQTKILTERGDIGQWINVPYFNGVKGLRYAIDVSSAPISIENFIRLVNQNKLTIDQLTNIKVNVKNELEDGPPCLQYLIIQSIPNGMRGDCLFNLGVYLQKSMPDSWESSLEDYNIKYADPPMKSAEVQGILKSLQKKDYFYTCNKQPLNSYCNKSLCMIRKYGIGTSCSITISSLTKYDSTPPIWFVNVEGSGRIELMTEDLQNPIKFQRRCMEGLNIMPVIPKKDSWQQMIQKALEEVIIVDAPADASTGGQLIEYLEKFCTSRVQAQNRDELLLGKPLLEKGKHVFRMSDFMAYLERQHFREFKVNKVTSIIKEQLKADHCFFLLKGKGVNCWSIKEFQTQKESHDVPDFENNQPY